MNRGLNIFKRHHRLQGGTEEVPPWLKAGYKPPKDFAETDTWTSPSGTVKHASAKEASGLYAPEERPVVMDDEQGHDADLAHLSPAEQAQEQADWNENIKSILASTPNLDPEERDQVLNLNPKDWDDSTKEKVGAASEKAGTDMQLARGTSNVNNPGLFFYHRKLINKPRKNKNV